MHIQEREASSLASVLLKVVRKNIAQREKEREYKELAHAVMEVEKAPDLSSTSYRPRRINGVVPIQVWRPESQEGRWFSSNPGAMGLKPKSYSFSLHLKIGKDWCPSSAGRQPFCSVTGWGPTHIRGDNLLYWGYQFKNIHLIWKHPQAHPRQTLEQMSGHPVAY